MLTAEYFVLHGACSLALPLKLGQQLVVDSVNNNEAVINWNSFYAGECWFHARFNRLSLVVEQTSHANKALFIQQLLREAERLNKESVTGNNTLNISTKLDFHPNWGLGSSSSLLSNVAYWTDNNPYLLLKNTTGGSGYDIACGRASNPIIFKTEGLNPLVEATTFNPTFRQNLYFVYLGNKISSAKSIQQYRAQVLQNMHHIQTINKLTLAFTTCSSVKQCMQLIDEHEAIVAQMLQTNPIKLERFSDFNGSIKSLGAWGGDFILAASYMDENDVYSYFRSKALTVIFKYNDLVL